MAIIPEFKELFQIHGPAILRKGETGIFAAMYVPEFDSALGYTYKWGICRPDSSQVTPSNKAREIVTPGMGVFETIGFDSVTFTPTQYGTHYIGLFFIGLANAKAIMSFHVPAWLDNIDRPISDITKSNTEISRLKTNFIRNAGR